MAIPKSNLLEYCDFTQCSTIQTRHYPPTSTPTYTHTDNIPLSIQYHTPLFSKRNILHLQGQATNKLHRTPNSPPSLPHPKYQDPYSPNHTIQSTIQNITARTGLVRGKLDTIQHIHNLIFPNSYHTQNTQAIYPPTARMRLGDGVLCLPPPF